MGKSENLSRLAEKQEVSENIEYLKHYYQDCSDDQESKNLQVNIRISERLLKDIEFIANLLHVDRSEWIRVEIAKSVLQILNKKKTIHFRTARERYVKGEIDNKHYARIVGYEPPLELINERKKEVQTIKIATQKTKEHFKNIIKK